MRKSIVVFSLILVVSLSAAAQKSEVGIVAGGKMTSDGTSPVTGKTTVNTAFAFEVNYATQLISLKAAALELNIPLLAVPTSEINTSNLFTAKSYSSIYLTPGVRVRLGTVLSPYVEAGAGVVRFGPRSTPPGGTPRSAPSPTTAAFHRGAGADPRPSTPPWGR